MSEERELDLIWAEHRDQTLARVAAIRLALGSAQRGQRWEVGDPRRDSSRADAHTLAGGAAIFGAHEAARLAKQLEAALEGAEPLEAADLAGLDVVAADLERALRERR